MEVKLDQDVLTEAVAKAIIALLDGDKDKILAAFVSDILGSKVNTYGGIGQQSLFEQILREEILKETKIVLQLWLSSQRELIEEMLTAELTENALQEITKGCVDNLRESITKIKH